ncbi:hypothetical protein ScalyP_jg7001 [Parmales sp. scaly parma]|nr:hypothetical protein ScalyP_jg7001 [Parmales sp. scaly parma]
MSTPPPKKKQKATDGSAAVTSKQIVFLPIAGAQGKLGKDSVATLEMLVAETVNLLVVERVQRTYNDDDKTVRKQQKKETDEEYTEIVRTFDEARAIKNAAYPSNMTGGNGATAKVIGHAMAQLLHTCSSYPGAEVYFYTNSFGGRLAIHTILQRSEDKSDEADPYKLLEGSVRDVEGNETELSYPVTFPDYFKGVISCGYPLEGKGPLDRREVLRRLKSEAAGLGLKFLFLAGDKDVETPTLVKDLTEIFGEKTRGVKIVAVAGGGHNVWKKLPEDEMERVKGEVHSFLGV